jgi:glucose/arabinose dehydrogenase
MARSSDSMDHVSKIQTLIFFFFFFIVSNFSGNRQQFSGYQVLFVPFDNSTRLPSTLRDPIPFLTGFIRNEKDSTVYGRPVGVLAIKNALLVADDSGDAIWKVEKQ